MFPRLLVISALIAGAATSQDAGPLRAALHQRLGEIKQSMARNQAQLRQYSWTETIEINLKGEEKKRTQASCQYGPDGKVQKTEIGNPAPPPRRRGIKGRIVTKKIDEMKDYMDRVGSLMRRYVPPSLQDMQAAFEAGKMTMNPVSGELVLNDYVKPGDRVTIAVDGPTKRLLTFSVATYLDDAQDAVMMDARFSSLPDGTNYVAQTVLEASAKKIEIITTNFGYRKLGS